LSIGGVKLLPMKEVFPRTPIVSLKPSIKEVASKTHCSPQSPHKRGGHVTPCGVPA